jgi:hypothetical protein
MHLIQWFYWKWAEIEARQQGYRVQRHREIRTHGVTCIITHQPGANPTIFEFTATTPAL